MPARNQTPMGEDITPSLLNTIAERLAKQGFSVQHSVTAGPYIFDILATIVGTPTGSYVPIPWSTLIAVSQLNTPNPETVRAFSPFVAKYSLDNRSSFGGYRMDMKTIAVIISPTFSDETKKSVSETRPESSGIKDRFEFPVLVELNTRQVVYFRKTPFRAGLLYRQLRKLSDGWFSFQI